MNKIINPNDFIQIMQERFDNNLPVCLSVTGSSMVPFLADCRDSVILNKYNGNAKKGDILFYLRSSDKCVLHRVINTTDDGIYFIGDSQTVIEGPISNEKILAECHSVIRKGKVINKSSFIWFFFRYIWINIIRFRLPIINFISKFK